MKRRRKKVYIQWFLSYVAIMLPPIIIGFIVYTHTLQANRLQAERLNKSLMQVVKNEFDNQVNEVTRCLNRFAMDANVHLLSNARGKFHPQDQYNLYTLYNNVMNVNFSEQYCDEVFVYFKNTRMIVSTHGNMTYELYHDLYGSVKEYTMPDMESYLGEFHYRDVQPLSDEQNRYLLFTMTCLKSDVGETSATVGVRLNVNTLDELFDAARWDEGIQLVIIDEYDRILNSSDTAEPYLSLHYRDLEPGGEFMTRIQDVPYIGTVMESEQRGWKYVILSPQALVEENARQIQKFCLLGLYASIIIGLFLSGYLSKVNYNPLKGLLDTFKKQGNISEEDENEFQWLNRQTERFFSDYNDAKRLLGYNSKKLKEYNLLKLLEYSYDPKAMEGDFQKYRLREDAPYNAVIIFAVESIKEKKEMTDAYTQENALHKFILTNVFEEKVLEYYLIEMTELGEQVTAIVNLPNQDEAGERLKNLVEETQQMIEEKFGFSVTAFMGAINAGIEGIHESYAQAREVAEYAELLDAEFVIYDDVKNVQKKYMYSIEMEQKIINGIKVGNSKAAYENLIQVFDQNFEDGISIDVCRCLIFDMMGTLLKGAEEGGYYTFAEDFHFSNELSAKLPLEELKGRFQKIVEEICVKILEMQKETQEDKKLSHEVENYILENYGDPDLNISILGQEFHMTPAYLSAIYKKQTGKSLLDFINQIRVEKAEALLIEGRSVVETAQIAGFRDSGAFIRVFKKKRGVTPGQLKRNL